MLNWQNKTFCKKFSLVFNEGKSLHFHIRFHYLFFSIYALSFYHEKSKMMSKLKRDHFPSPKDIDAFSLTYRCRNIKTIGTNKKYICNIITKDCVQMKAFVFFSHQNYRNQLDITCQRIHELSEKIICKGSNS